MTNKSNGKLQMVNKNLAVKKTLSQLEFGDKVWQAPRYGQRDEAQGQFVSMKDSQNKVSGDTSNPNQDTDAGLNIPMEEQG